MDAPSPPSLPSDLLAAARVALIPIDQLQPMPDNPRTITPRAAKGLDASIDTFGLVEPLVWNRRTGHVVGGHQRLDRLRLRGYKSLPAVVVDLDPDREKALNLALNNDALQGSFTEEATALLEAAKASLDPALFDALRFEEIYYPGKVLEFVPGAALDYGLAEATAEHLGEPGPPSSGIRSLRLILDDNQMAEVKGLIRDLGNAWGIESPPDVVIRALRVALERERALADQLDRP